MMNRLWTFSISNSVPPIGHNFLSRIGKEWPMHSGRIIFSQLMNFFPRHEFNKCVRRYQGEYRTRNFSCFDQFLCIGLCPTDVSGEPSRYRNMPAAMQSRLYHAGFRGKSFSKHVGRCQRKRDCVSTRLRSCGWSKRPESSMQARTSDCKSPKRLTLWDSTTIDLCLSLFPWASFRQQKGAIKLHTEMDLRGSIPCLIRILMGKFHDVTFLDQLVLEPAAFYVMDRGYIDFARLYRFTQKYGVFCDTGEKATSITPDAPHTLSIPEPDYEAIRSFCSGVPKPLNSIRIHFGEISFFDIGEHRPPYLSNEQLCLTRPDDCSTSSKRRWKIELFFKWIKQNLRIKAFYGTSEERLENSNLDCHLCLSVGSDHPRNNSESSEHLTKFSKF